jgi:hypothetical protein
MNLSIFALLSSGLGVRVTRDGACNQRLEGPDLPNEVAGSTGAPVVSCRAVTWRRRRAPSGASASGDLAPGGGVVATKVRVSAGGRRKARGVGMGAVGQSFFGREQVRVRE